MKQEDKKWKIKSFNHKFSIRFKRKTKILNFVIIFLNYTINI